MSHNISLNTPTSEKSQVHFIEQHSASKQGPHKSQPTKQKEAAETAQFQPVLNCKFEHDGCFCFHHNATFQFNEKHTASPRKKQPLLQTIPLTSYTTELRKQSSHFLTPSPPSSTLLAQQLRPRSAPNPPDGICCFCFLAIMPTFVLIHLKQN